MQGCGWGGGLKVVLRTKKESIVGHCCDCWMSVSHCSCDATELPQLESLFKRKCVCGTARTILWEWIFTLHMSLVMNPSASVVCRTNAILAVRSRVSHWGVSIVVSVTTQLHKQNPFVPLMGRMSVQLHAVFVCIHWRCPLKWDLHNGTKLILRFELWRCLAVPC